MASRFRWKPIWHGTRSPDSRTTSPTACRTAGWDDLREPLWVYVLIGIGGVLVLIAVVVVVVQLSLGRAAQRRREQLEAKHRAEMARETGESAEKAANNEEEGPA